MNTLADRLQSHLVGIELYSIFKMNNSFKMKSSCENNYICK
jgi:hypothetical protein